ncbi:hypothetical protein M409DRAFT_65087 [Zasmidium cellare ATCC 36951]|uniref:NAD(P)-binding protein n=1 Tax=Zasmidium cellare ATCC 36951 TaxID=1080233 RepID=A0A6A6CQI0_ZASCE|nr:uncharacterized protein M409DRAFT_65087 [Zasmidium cellare ATCC 36951]KAF2169414.1 hypothetical protein M409DRAFT_65087 [Zasmidium cellare ATCC 36951]
MASSRDKWALITGVSEGGLGDALATELLGHGINVIATALDLGSLDYLKPPGQGRLERLQLDVTSSTSISSAVAETQRITGGGLDFLINNAGYGYMMPLLDASIAKIKQNFDVNVFGLIEVTQAFFPLLRTARGMVINQSSIAGMTGICQPFIGTYSASKMAVTDFSNTMRVELEPFGVKVVTLFTGDVRTSFWQQGHAQGSDKGLPPSSPYNLMKDHAEAMMRGETNPAGQHSRERWAREVVGDLLKTNPPAAVRRGYLAESMWWLSALSPVWLLDLMFWQTCKFSAFRTRLQGDDSKKER